MSQTKVLTSSIDLGSGRTLETKLLDIINANDYGAASSATATANTAAINAAITAAAAAGCGYVAVNSNISYTESSLAMVDGVVLQIHTSNGVVIFLSKDHGSSPIAKGGIAFKSQNHTGIMLRAVDLGVSGDPLLQIVDLTTGDTGAIHSNFIEMDERTAPATPSGNKMRLYCRDNGSGKTQLVVQFPTGAVQVVATEP